jgi:hypothetical protein
MPKRKQMQEPVSGGVHGRTQFHVFSVGDEQTPDQWDHEGTFATRPLAVEAINKIMIKSGDSTIESFRVIEGSVLGLTVTLAERPMPSAKKDANGHNAQAMPARRGRPPRNGAAVAQTPPS